MSNVSPEEVLFEKISRAIDICQEIHNDSRTPLEDAQALTPLIRNLLEYKRKLRASAFTAAGANTEYENAISALGLLNNAVKAEIIAHEQTMGFIKNTADAVTAVLDLAIAVGAIAG